MIHQRNENIYIYKSRDLKKDISCYSITLTKMGAYTTNREMVVNDVVEYGNFRCLFEVNVHFTQHLK